MARKRPKPRLKADGRDLRALLKGSAWTIGVGVFSGAHEPSGLPMVELAAIHEYGAPAANIPERSFLRAPLRDPKTRARLRTAVKIYIRQMAEKRTTRAKALTSLGEWMVLRVRQAILSGGGVPPPLKPETIARKGSSRPLVDTGALLNAITWRKTNKGRF